MYLLASPVMAAGSVARAVIAFVVLAALHVPGVVARHGSDLLDIPGAEFISVNTLPFGFEAGGSVFVSAAYPAGVSNYNPVQFMFCSFADRNKVRCGGRGWTGCMMVS